MITRTLTTALALTLSATIFSPLVSANTEFKDIPKSYWAYDTIQWAVKEEITKGYQDNTFKPNKLITEAEFLALLLNFFPNVKLTTMTSGHWADKYYEQAHASGLAVTDQRSKPISRGLVAMLISEAFGFDYNQNKAIEYLYQTGLSQGKTGQKTIEDYHLDDFMTRAEAVQFIRNLYLKGQNQKFSGIKTVSGKYADFLKKVKTYVHKEGYDINLKEETGDFNINKEYVEGGVKLNKTVITFSRSSSGNSSSNYFNINNLDPEVLKLSKRLLIDIGVPVDNQFEKVVNDIGLNGKEYKKKYGKYFFNFTGNHNEKKVSISFRSAN